MDTIKLNKNNQTLICNIDRVDQFKKLGWSSSAEHPESEEPKLEHQEVENNSIPQEWDQRSRRDLLALAEKKGIELPQRVSKEKIVELLKEALN